MIIVQIRRGRWSTAAEHARRSVCECHKLEWVGLANKWKGNERRSRDSRVVQVDRCVLDLVCRDAAGDLHELGVDWGKLQNVSGLGTGEIIGGCIEIEVKRNIEIFQIHGVGLIQVSLAGSSTTVLSSNLRRDWGVGGLVERASIDRRSREE